MTADQFKITFESAIIDARRTLSPDWDADIKTYAELVGMLNLQVKRLLAIWTLVNNEERDSAAIILLHKIKEFCVPDEPLTDKEQKLEFMLLFATCGRLDYAPLAASIHRSLILHLQDNPDMLKNILQKSPVH